MRAGAEGNDEKDEMVDGIMDSMDVNLSEFRELVMDREAWRAVVHAVAKIGHYWATELNWTIHNYKFFFFSSFLMLKTFETYFLI